MHLAKNGIDGRIFAKNRKRENFLRILATQLKRLKQRVVFLAKIDYLFAENKKNMKVYNLLIAKCTYVVV